MTARHHHYLSQCYLKGFTKGFSKKSKLTVIDFKEKRDFETIPRNVGGRRDFNRIEIEGIDPNAIESALSIFEGQANTALKKIEEKLVFEGEIKVVILNLLALLAIRSPEMREHWSNTEIEIMERIMDLSLETKERWESQNNRMKKDGVNISDDITYEEVKEFYDNKKYRIELTTDYHIRIEMDRMESILPYLFGKNWLLVKANKESGPFITTDNPVILTWNEPDQIPLMHRDNPGYGMKKTQVYFPISKNLSLIGEFDGREGIINGNKQLVATLNSKMLLFTYKQIYAPTIRFFYLDKDSNILQGNHILREINA